MYEIVRAEAFSDVTFLWEVLAPDVARAARPGHFVMLRLHEGSERIPLTVADYDQERGTVTIVIQALGKTTREMRDGYRTGDTFADFVGPLGLPAHTDENYGHVVLVGGGLGVAPVYPQLRALAAAGNRTTGIIGFRNRDLVFWEDRFGKYCNKMIVCTDDGSYGRPGFVTAALEDICRDDKPDLVIAIGPLPMMRACVETTRPFGVKTMVSLNAIMVDGTGMCGSCRVTVDGTVRFACVDGPDFDGHLVDFHELMLRQQRFRPQETTAEQDWDHVCNLEKQLFEEQKRNYKKIKELPPEQTPMRERDADARSRSFDEVNLGYTLSDALGESERCIQCKKPTCIAGCPVAIDIPRFLRHLAVRDIDGALAVIHESNLFPSICGRVCPQESQCEAQCIIGKKVEPVAIGRLERFVGDNAKPPVAVPAPNSGELGHVAVVGSGPAGLAAAADLVRMGAAVTIYEALHVPGGVLRYGIPSFRLPRNIIDRELRYLQDLGVRIETNKVIGKTFTVQQLLEDKGHDAVFLGVGAGAPVFLGIPGELAGRVYSANEFLTRVNLMGGDKFPYRDTPVSLGESVVVIGAGNTAMDCLRVSKRLGAPTVRCVYRRSEAEAPARVEEIRHAKEEGIEFFFLHTPVEILATEDGDVHGMKVEKMELGEPDESGRRRPMGTGEFLELACDTVIYALGTRANPIITKSTPGLELNKWGNIQADDVTQATSLKGVFAGGDIVTGGATVILALGAGRRAAKAIAAYLCSEDRHWPVTEADLEGAAGEAAKATVAGEDRTRGEGTRASVAGGSDAGASAVAGAAGGSDAGASAVAGAAGGSDAGASAVAGGSGAGASILAGDGVGGSAESGVALCPKCRRPLEDGESYVCCANALLSWRCDSCSKLSEGFAFPYGQCPACGGHLRVMAKREVADEASLAAVRAAFEIELGGRAFYAGAAASAGDSVLEELFGRFAEMENEHMETLARRYHIEAPAPDSGMDAARAAIYARVPNRPEDPVNLFRIAIGFEKRAVEFFESRIEQCPAGSAERRLYEELAAEEREHVDLLSTELARYVQGKPGLL